MRLAVRRALHQPTTPIAIDELFAGAPAVKSFRPSTSTERDLVRVFAHLAAPDIAEAPAASRVDLERHMRHLQNTAHPAFRWVDG